VDGFDQQIDQIVRQSLAAPAREGRQPGQAGRLRMPTQLIGGFDGDASAPLS
jgi:hypothetical protein